MVGLNPDLIKVLNDFIINVPYECVIAQGLRTREYQYNLWRSGFDVDGTRNDGKWLTNANGTPKGETSPEGSPGTGLSNHQSGCAVDIAVVIDGVANWNLKYYSEIAPYMIQSGKNVGVDIVWGGCWPAPKTDSDHFEINQES